MILATVTYDVDLSPLNQRWTRKYQLGFLSRVSTWAGNIRRQGNIKGFISCQETTKGKYQTAHWYTETTETCIGPQGRPIPTFIHIYTRTHVIYVYACIHTYRRVSKPHSDVQHLWDFLVFDQLAHPLCVPARQANKLRNKQINKHINI